MLQSYVDAEGEKGDGEGVKHKDDQDVLLDAVMKYIKAKGGNVVVIGGIEIQRFPGDAKYNFRLAIRCTGEAPTNALR